MTESVTFFDLADNRRAVRAFCEMHNDSLAVFQAEKGFLKLPGEVQAGKIHIM